MEMDSARLKSEARRQKILLKSEERMQKLLGTTDVPKDFPTMSNAVPKQEIKDNRWEQSEEEIRDFETRNHRENFMLKNSDTLTSSSEAKMPQSPPIPWIFRNNKYIIIFTAILSRLFVQPGIYFHVLLFLEGVLFLKNLLYSDSKSSNVVNLLVFAVQRMLSRNQQAIFSRGLKMLMDSLECMFLFSFTFITMHVAWSHVYE